MAVNPLGLDTFGSTLTTTKLDELIDGGMQRRAAELVRTTALLILDLSQTFCPVDTGHLKASLQVGGDENVYEISDGGLVAIIGTHVYYAVFVEFGTRNMNAQPFLSPAVELVRDSWAEGIAAIFGESVLGI